MSTSTGTDFTTLTTLHCHYRHILALERESIAAERRLWDQERELYVRRINELEHSQSQSQSQSQPIATIPSSAPLPQVAPAPEITTPEIPTLMAASMTSTATTVATNQREEPNWQFVPPQLLLSHATAGKASFEESQDGEEEEEEEEHEDDMAALIQEATRIVGVRGRAMSLADPPPDGDCDGGDDTRREDREESEEIEEAGIELRLKKTSNFGLEFGKSWRYMHHAHF
jgi:hypothetical protein